MLPPLPPLFSSRQARSLPLPRLSCFALPTTILHQLAIVCAPSLRQQHTRSVIQHAIWISFDLDRELAWPQFAIASLGCNVGGVEDRELTRLLRG